MNTSGFHAIMYRDLSNSISKLIHTDAKEKENNILNVLTPEIVHNMLRLLLNPDLYNSETKYFEYPNILQKYI